MQRVKFSKRMVFSLLGLTGVLWAVAAWGRSERVEVRPEVSIPATTSDVDRIMTSYEKLMDRFLDQNQAQLISVAEENKGLSERLDQLDRKLNLVLKKLTRIEKAMGIPPEAPLPPTTPNQAPNPGEPGPTH